MKDNRTLTFHETVLLLFKRLRAMKAGKPSEPHDYDLVEWHIRRQLANLQRDEASVANLRKDITELLGFIEFKKRETRLAAILTKMGFDPTMKGAK
jgi:hypothetical protein